MYRKAIIMAKKRYFWKCSWEEGTGQDRECHEVKGKGGFDTPLLAAKNAVGQSIYNACVYTKSKRKGYTETVGYACNIVQKDTEARSHVKVDQKVWFINPDDLDIEEGIVQGIEEYLIHVRLKRSIYQQRNVRPANIAPLTKAGLKQLKNTLLGAWDTQILAMEKSLIEKREKRDKLARELEKAK
jgi:hypothetical protein